MEKYGVSLNDAALKKEAGKGTKSDNCPKCDHPLIENNQFLLWCKNCGTEPFERKP